MSKVALILGGAGNIGSATAKAFLQNGCCKNVVITSRDQERINKAIAVVKDSLGSDAASKIIGVVGSTGEEKAADALSQKVIAEVGDKLDFVVSCAGFPFCKMTSMLEITKGQLQQVLETQFFPMAGAYRVLMPLVKNCGGSYIFVTGGGPDMYLGPGTGVMTIGGSAATAFSKVAMKESAADGVCCSEVSFSTGIAPDPTKMPPGYNWLTSADAGKALVSVATKRRAHVQTITISNQAEMDQAIENGLVQAGSGVA